MSETPKDKDQEKGDEVLRRLLNTPPKPHDAPKPKSASGSKKDGDKAPPSSKATRRG